MSTQNLINVAIDVANRYNEAGEVLGRAYRTGVSRAASAFDERFATAVASDRGLALFGENVKQSLIDAQKQISSIIASGLIAGSERACEARERIAGEVKKGIERVGTGSEAGTANTLADSLATITLPSAQLSLAVATAVAEGAKRVGERVAEESDDAQTVVDATPARKRAKR